MEQYTLELEVPTGAVLETVTDSELYAELQKRAATRKKPNLIRFPADVYPHVQPWAHEDREHFLTVCLDGQHSVIGIPHVISIGLVNRALVHPREVLKPAVVASAAAIVIAHNHPSGNTEPSVEDAEITRKLNDACKLIGIPLLDHLVFTTASYYSFLEQDKLG